MKVTDALRRDHERLAWHARGVGSQRLERLHVLQQLFLDDLSVLLGQLLHGDALHKLHRQIHGAVVLKRRHECGQRYVGPFAQIPLDGDVGLEPLGQGGRRRQDVVITEVRPLVPPQGPLDEQLSQEVEFPIGKNSPAAGLSVLVQKIRRRH
ncbi:hypothetical protein TOPH_09210 [Tolypocladium ophioglossoides CBS 100239]|uniref:Uncharacterized protein n=1 Tax=Tolypocladium ophioglossoides (strain CBS 100239) TaxID=1163406 RepID=A0A0L0MWK6_TOLOC|nr:hypothetical protein TOPH_09210 [Tolypocladium ophioglossoides CBS 100239]